MSCLHSGSMIRNVLAPHVVARLDHSAVPTAPINSSCPHYSINQPGTHKGCHYISCFHNGSMMRNVVAPLVGARLAHSAVPTAPINSSCPHYSINQPGTHKGCHYISCFHNGSMMRNVVAPL